MEDFHVKARCYRSLRKSEEPHFLAVIFSECDGRAEVFKTHCSCKGGSGGHCNHVFALLFQFNDYSCLNMTDIPSDATCTSLPQSWGEKFYLKKEHTCGYYAQVQGQLALTGLKWCDFCIYFLD